MKFGLLFVLLLTACGPRKETVGVINGSDGKDGRDGENGNDGKNGHSLVSEYVESSELECSNGGTRLDIYLDLDDSLSASEADQYLNSLIACNGANGLNGQAGAQGEAGPAGLQGEIGPQGTPGEAGAQGPVGPMGPQGPQGEQGEQGLPGANGSSGATVTSYTSSNCTLVSGSSYYVKNNGSNSGIYTTSTCSSNSKVFEMGNGDAFWFSGNILGVKLVSGGVRVINFNL